ncbi:MAG: AAA ATPase central domain protein [Parcubacteria group bacterium GW2011_GWA1_53_13]|nr:MAG: AAA ATPase central domain protein [Parcubacteria group bacterium GW2011_GWA1_53_13]
MEPLANKIRPTTLKDFVGQEHLVGKNKPLREAIEQKHLFSFLLWGPPGSGKTTLARIYAGALNAEFHELSAVDSGKEDIKKILDKKGQIKFDTRPKILFVDEIHRFNKAQQDFLLPFVERGDLTLIGATTENPSFEVIGALLSRSRVFVLNELGEKEMEAIIKRTKFKIPKDAREWLIQVAQGDARQAITVLENAQKLYGATTLKSLQETVQSKHLRYDKKGEEHYNTISAFIKSMRAGQPDAALYYLARMVDSGEDPLFIARRMVVFASEDIGLAVPTALVVANAVFRACETIGYPECAINLAQGVVYLAECKKSRKSYDAYFEALDDVKKLGNLPIPMRVRNAPTKLMKELGYHKGYKLYDKESYLPDKLKNKKYLK